MVVSNLKRGQIYEWNITRHNIKQLTLQLKLFEARSHYDEFTERGKTPMSASTDRLKPIRTREIEPIISDLVVPPAESNLRKILSLMREKGIQEVLLPERYRCAMISVMEILRCSNIDITKPSSVMVHVPILAIDASIAQAARIMVDYGIKTIPVSDNRKIVGQVNGSSMLPLLKGNLGDLRVSSIATPNPITANADDLVATARELMIRKKIDHLPVKEGDKLIGMITSAEVISVISPRGRIGTKSTKTGSHPRLDLRVRNIMDAEPLSLSPQTSAEDALNRMLNIGKTSVLVTQWEELQAIVTQHDYLSLLAEPEKKPASPLYIVGLPNDPFEAEAAKQKFRRTIDQLRKISPDVLEARSIIKTKTSAPGKERRRYEVTVHIKTPKNSYSYAATGWELAQVYDIIAERLKRLLAQKDRRRKHTSKETKWQTEE
jgi:CBS domain-containing protein